MLHAGPTPGNAIASSSQIDIPIDPALMPLPDDDETDFPSVKTLLSQKGKATSKVAGSCRPSVNKGKQCAVPAIPLPGKAAKRKAANSIEPDAKKSRGRTPGTANYSTDDLDALMDILEVSQPLGLKAWNNVADEFNQWAEGNDRPVQTTKSLENKFKQVCYFL